MLSIALFASLAMADVPPPPGYVESCTVEKAKKRNPGHSCTSCDAWHGGREPCEALEAAGWMHECRTSGASTWDEVFCVEGEVAVPGLSPTPTADPEAADKPTSLEPAKPKAQDTPPAPATTDPAPTTPEPTADKKECSVSSAPASWAFLVVPLLVVGRRR